MSSLVRQGFQSCLGPRLGDQRALLGSPKTHSFQRITESTPQSNLVPPKPGVCESDSDTETGLRRSVAVRKTGDNDSSEHELGIWSSVQSISNSPKEGNKQSIYVHPLTKRSSSTLSEKSLELCTESLGCESGTELSDKDYFAYSSSSSDSSSDESEINFLQREKANYRRVVGRRTVDFKSFPPPLTSISRRDSVHVWSHRQDGRLVLKAFAAPSPHTYFQAQRTDGRLKLSFLTKPSQDTNDVEAAKEEAAAEEESSEEEEKEEREEIDLRSVEKNQNKENYDDDDDDNNNNNSNISNNNGEVEGGQLHRPSRCKEGSHDSNKGMKIWEPCWVATS